MNTSKYSWTKRFFRAFARTGVTILFEDNRNGFVSSLLKDEFISRHFYVYHLSFLLILNLRKHSNSVYYKVLSALFSVKTVVIADDNTINSRRRHNNNNYCYKFFFAKNYIKIRSARELRVILRGILTIV